MAIVKAFGALRFTEKAGPLEQVVCPPYDIISEDERRAYLAHNDHNIIRLELPREGSDPYAQAGEILRQWLDESILSRDKEGLYIYEEEFSALGKTMKIKGLVCRVRLETFDKNIVLPHEETLSKAKTDRFNLMCATECNFSSIYSLYSDKEGAVSGMVEEKSSGKADYSITTADGIVHRVWSLYDPQVIDRISRGFSDKKIYIADGHHRYETALNYKKHLESKGVVVDDNHPANYIMMTLVDMENKGLVVFPTHRVVRGLPGFDFEKLLKDCQSYFQLEDCPVQDMEPRLQQLAGQGKKAFGVYHNRQSKLLVLSDSLVMKNMLPVSSEAYRGLDVNILHLLILERLLDIDKENMANQKNLVYTRSAEQAVAAVDQGNADCAFLINATRVDEIADVAAAGEKMPQKSTYFYPKIITGLLMNPLF